MSGWVRVQCVSPNSWFIGKRCSLNGPCSHSSVCRSLQATARGRAECVLFSATSLPLQRIQPPTPPSHRALSTHELLHILCCRCPPPVANCHCSPRSLRSLSPNIWATTKVAVTWEFQVASRKLQIRSRTIASLRSQITCNPLAPEPQFIPSVNIFFF